MMKMQWFKREQPISLKWKWGVLLFTVFFVVGVGGLLLYHNHLRNAQREALMSVYQEQFDAVVDYLESFDTLHQFNSSDIELEQLPEEILLTMNNDVLKFLESQTHDEVIFRIFNRNNRLIYFTKHIQLPKIEMTQPLKLIEIDKVVHLVASAPIMSKQSNRHEGTIQFIIQATSLMNREHNQVRVFLIALSILLVVSILLAIIVTSQFLRPLNYLNNALDLVEEESLSELRMRKPRSVDEWSDLTLHINRMLDKIDLYVKNQKQFVEDVSHELRTPVAIVEGHLTMLNRWGKNDPEVLEESISASLQEISRMKGLVQEMLDLMRADHAEVDYKDEITNVYSTTRQVYNNFVMLYPEFQFYLDADKKEDELYIRMFRNHFEQVLIILLDNAVKYSTDRKEIHLSVSTTLSEIEIAIQDFGEGMTEEDKERVFGRFYRVDKARSRDKGGNGLGLSIAQQLVQSYKGAIRVESVLNHGSIFYISFPILDNSRQIYKSKQKAIKKNL
ncbi:MULTISPECIES: HAMP domain-containing sensor histidine kinase [unclassified Facklamia]|uniref:sensor histidine kinase n=1 Tax=Aerococcaceae TaxID=186827 RepID=UPI0013BD79E6|nr:MULTISPECIES: HAMP domain-containing sensor histidine kinase [unclassified Facklamia]NEW63582.1 HAMP domain-containing protein [Facklamia sp. 252]NEW67053.1 HAMP domain-containing protein [Facklamia sp. 253]